jgi:hypothetical protein
MKYISRMILGRAETLKRREWNNALEVGCRVISSSRLKSEALALASTPAMFVFTT